MPGGYGIPPPNVRSLNVNVGTLDLGEVEVKNDTGSPVPVEDDNETFLAQHFSALVPEDDTEVTFAQECRIFRVVNWSTTDRILVKDGVITDSSDPTATRVGKAPKADVPLTRTLPYKGTTIHILSAGSAECTVEGYIA